MSALEWRDKTTGRTICWPWPVEGYVFTLDVPISKQTALGSATLIPFTLEDASLGLALIHPQGARFARVSPETDWALEERREGVTPPEITADLDKVWIAYLSRIAARNKELREKGGAPNA